MNKRFIYLTFLLMLFCIKNSSQECLCSGRRIGRYCGTELNQINGNSDCDRNMYFCGTTNRNKTAVLLKSCPTGRECDVILRGRNACLRRIDCRCGRGIGRGPHCGNQLQGSDCGPNVMFMCRRIGSPFPRDACPDGCNAGKCIVAAQVANKVESNSKAVNSDNVPEVQQKSVNKDVTQTPRETEQ